MEPVHWLAIASLLAFCGAVGAAGHYVWRRWKSLSIARDAASALTDAHARASYARTAKTADLTEHLAGRATELGDSVSQVAAGVGAVSELLGEVPRTKLQAQWDLAYLVLGGKRHGARH